MGDISDRFPGHPSSIDCMLKVDEETVLTGSSDGFIRVVSFFPINSFTGSGAVKTAMVALKMRVFPLNGWRCRTIIAFSPAYPTMTA